MNVQQALKRLDHIQQSANEAKTILDLIDRRDRTSNRELAVQVYNAQGSKYDCDERSGRYCVIDVDLLRDAVEKTAERRAAEAAKLQPVIDMAEAALKGVLAAAG